MHNFSVAVNCQSTHRTVFLGADVLLLFLSNEAIWLMPHPLPKAAAPCALKE